MKWIINPKLAIKLRAVIVRKNQPMLYLMAESVTMPVNIMLIVTHIKKVISLNISI